MNEDVVDDQNRDDRDHPSKILTVKDQEAAIDLNIYQLIRRIWLSGITTDHSCENVNDPSTNEEPIITIGFERCSDFNKFMWICFSVLDISDGEKFIIDTPFCTVMRDRVLDGGDFFEGIDEPPLAYLEHLVNIRFPAALQPKIEAAFDGYLRKQLEGPVFQLESLYDEVKSGEQLARYFFELIQLYFSDPFKKLSAYDLSAMCETCKNIDWVAPIELKPSPPDRQRRVAVIPDFEAKLNELRARRGVEIPRGERNIYSLMLFSSSEEKQEGESSEKEAGKRSRSPSPSKGGQPANP